MAERLNMAEVPPSGDSGSQASKGATAVAERLDQPDVVIADEGTRSKSPGFWRKITGRETKPLVLVPPSHVTEILNPEEQPENTIGPTQPPDSVDPLAAEVMIQTGWEGGPPPPSGGDGGGNGSEGPRVPEPPSGPEWETSPERGREIVERIIHFRTQMSYEERYNEINGPLLAQAYRELQEYIDRICEIRDEKDPWDRYVRDDEGKVSGVKVIEDSPLMITYEETSDGKRIPHLIKPQSNQNTLNERPVTEEELRSLEEGNKSLGDVLQGLLVEYGKRNTSATRRLEIQGKLDIYFGIAKEKGLLKGVDQVLTSIAGNIKSVPENQVRRIMSQRISEAEEAAELTFESKSIDQQVVDLDGVWRPYIRRALQRFELTLQNQGQPEYGVFEFHLPEGKGKETYWEVGNYPKYYHISARTPEQFLRAKDSFLSMIRRGSLGKAPEQIYEHVDNFKEVFGQVGNQEVEAGSVTAEFIRDQRLELEAILYVFGADYSNETYNPEQFKKFMTAMALHEGPDRWVRLIRAGDGQVAAFTQMFDKDLLMEIFTNPTGERGELDITAGHFLQDQVKQIAIGIGLGITLKDYDPNDPENTIRFIDDNNAEAVRAEEFKANLERIGIYMSDEELKNLYEGFDKGDAHINNYRIFGSLGKDQLKQLPDKLRDSINLGRIQIELKDWQDKIRKGEIKLERRDQTAVEFLNPEDRKAYRDVYAKTEANFDIAFQIQGASGEKVRRGRGFLYVDRNVHLQAYQRLQNIDDGKLTNEEKRSKKIGWMLTQLRENRSLKSLDKPWRDFYDNLSDEDKDDYVDNVPVYMAENFVQLAKNWTKMKYTDNSEAMRKAKTDPKYAGFSYAAIRQAKADEAEETAIKEIKRKGFEANLWDDELGVDEKPKPMIIKTPIGKINLETGKWEVSKNAQGDVIVDDQRLSFQFAQSGDFRTRYTTHTYWAYQGNNRHTLLAPRIFEAAERIRDGFSRPEDEDLLAVQLLIVDPTLKRVKRFDKYQQQREITLLQAAVEESYQGRQKTKRELHKAFLPKDGYRGKMRAGYDNEDWGGMMRFTMGFEELVASQPARFARRLGAEIAIAPIEIDAMGPIWGGHGVMGAINSLADQIKRITHQGVVGQFGITKYIDQQDYGVKIYEALVGAINLQTGIHEEGLYMKPTNDNDKLQQFYGKAGEIAELPSIQIPFLEEFRPRYSRLEKVLKLMRAMYSDVRNAGGALDLAKVDIFLEDGRFNPEIEENQEIADNTGTSRHSEKIFYDEFKKWLLSNEPGGGGTIYPRERYWNSFFNVKLAYYLGEKIEYSDRTIADWFFDKAGL